MDSTASAAPRRVLRSTNAGRPALGFTMLELMVAVGIAAILAAVAAPSLRDFGRESRLRSRAGELAADLNYARLEAIKRNARVLVCAKAAGGNACVQTTDWQYGWVVCYDADADDACDAATPADPNPMKVAATADNSLRLTSSVQRVRFNPVGTSSGAAVLTLAGTWPSSRTRTTDVAATGYVTSSSN